MSRARLAAVPLRISRLDSLHPAALEARAVRTAPLPRIRITEGFEAAEDKLEEMALGVWTAQ